MTARLGVSRLEAMPLGQCSARTDVVRRIAIMTDAHGNLPALRAALGLAEQEGCDTIYHTGDLIGTGPFPAECLALLLNTAKARPIMGNHDAWFASGLPCPRPAWMSEGELKHHRWVHAQLDPALRAEVASWPWEIRETIAGVRIRLMHYAFDIDRGELCDFVHDPSSEDLDRLFAPVAADLVFYGHVHRASEHQGQARYINPGSLGCFSDPIARFAVLEIRQDGSWAVFNRAPRYDDRLLFSALDSRRVPEREFIRRAFFPRPLRQGTRTRPEARL